MEKLYLKGWEYNTYLIINELSKIIKKEGGKIVCNSPYINTYKEKEITNRSILEEIAECEKFLNNKTEEEIKSNKFLKERQKRLKELAKIDNTPKKLLFQNYINFYLDGKIIYIQLNNNPFFNDYIIKEKAEEIKEGYQTRYNHYMEKLNKKWFENYENITSFYQTLSNKQVKELAKRLFEQILNAPFSEIVTEKRRIQNYFDDRFHYEYIKEERIKKYQVLDIL